MALGFNDLAERVANAILRGKSTTLTDLEFYALEIDRWLRSPQRQMQIKGQLYYDDEHDIIFRKRTMIGEDGKLQEVENLPNNRIIDNQYGKMVNQKTNYLVGKPFVIEGDNDAYVAQLKQVFDDRFMLTMKNAVKNSLNHGIAWLYPYYDDEGKLAFRVFPGYEIYPFWRDSEHTILDAAIRFYSVEAYEGRTPVIIKKVEIYDKSGISCYTYDGAALIPDGDTPQSSDYITNVDKSGKVLGFNWDRIPLIPIKYNERETPLLKRVKSLQDGINIMLSDFENNMQEDARNTILVLKNYDGTDLGEFRRNLATFGAIKVRYDDSAKGGVETLEITVNADNYKAIVEIFKKALIENAMGYDAKDDRLSGNPNQMNIQSMYSDIDLDANDMETELQAAFKNILWFVNAYLANAHAGNFYNEDVTIIFNRDILINETEAIENCQNSVNILSTETIIGQHPWINDPQQELERVKKEKEEQQQDMYNQGVFPGGGNPFEKSTSKDEPGGDK